LIRLRRENKVFIYGHYELLLPEHQQVYAYSRADNGAKYVVMANLSDKVTACDFGALDFARATYVLGNYPALATVGVRARVELRPFEARVYKLD
jgi:hypothetical protein